MKKLMWIGLILFLGVNCCAEPIRVFFEDNGNISVLNPSGKLYIPDSLKGIPYKDMDTSELPQTREYREKWRWNLTDKIIYIDNSVITAKEKTTAKKVELNTELEKEKPDYKKAFILLMEIQGIK